MCSEPASFPFLRLHAAPTKRPILWLLLENLHNGEGMPFIYPALVDSGADRSIVPYSLCGELGHVFDAGSSPSSTGGVGAGRVRTFSHASRITILATPENGQTPQPEDSVFFPIDLQLAFIEQELPFILLGQADFLQLFEYRQNRPENWFSLRRI